MRGKGTFTVFGWKDATVNERDGTVIGRASLAKKFEGDLVGTSTVDILTAVAVDGPAAYVGLEGTGDFEDIRGELVIERKADGSHAYEIEWEGT